MPLIHRSKPCLARLEAALAARGPTPFTWSALCAAAHCIENSMNKYKAQWLAEGRMHLAGWDEAVPMGRKPALYRAGPASAPPPRRAPFDPVKAARRWKQAHNYNHLQNRRRTHARQTTRTAERAASASSMLTVVLGLAGRAGRGR